MTEDRNRGRTPGGLGRVRVSSLVAGVLALLLSAGAASAEPLDQVARALWTAERDRAIENLISAPPSSGARTEAPRLRPPSTKRAFFLSLLLPGLGQRYLGQDRRATLYMGAELGVWIAVAGFWTQGSLREDRYREYASIVAGADPDVDDDEYYKNVALYSSSDLYDMVVRWDARALYDPDRAAMDRYIRENRYAESQSWSWPERASMDEYKRLRRRSKRAYRAAINTLGLAVLNRLVSAIDTVTGGEGQWTMGGLEPTLAVRTLPGHDSPAPLFLLRHSF